MLFVVTIPTVYAKQSVLSEVQMHLRDLDGLFVEAHRNSIDARVDDLG